MKNNDDQIDFNFSRSLDFQKNLKILNIESFSQSKIHLKDDDLLKKHIDLLLIELFFCWYESEKQFLTVSMSKRGYRAKSRYNPNFISSITIRAVKLLKSESLIDFFPGFYDSKRKISRLSRIRASNRLQQRFRTIEKFYFSGINHKKREYLIVKNHNKKFLEYSDNFKTHEIRDILRNYNDLLQKNFFDIPILEEQFILRGDKKKIIVSETSVNSNLIYTNDFDKNGIFGGSWWSKLDLVSTNKYLRSMVINYTETKHIDFSNIFLNFISKKLEKKIQPLHFDEKVFSNVGQINYLIIKGIRSRNFDSLFRSFLNDRLKLGFEKDIGKSEFSKLVTNFLDRNGMFVDFFYKQIDLDWEGSISSFFLKLIKQFANSNIPIYLVRDKILFAADKESIILQEIEMFIDRSNLFEGKFNLRSVGCVDYEFKEKKKNIR